MPDYAHLKLHDQFVALTDMKLHAPNQLYMHQINFIPPFAFEIKF